MESFGQKIRELRNAKGYSLRQLAPIVGVGFSYLSKVECERLPFGDSPSADLIIRLAEALDGDADELMLKAGRIPDSMVQRICEQPEAFRTLARCQPDQLEEVVGGLHKKR